MDTNAFAVGQTVQLKSGGPQMTVKAAQDAEHDVQCSWFTDGTLSHGFFKPDELTAVSGSVSGPPAVI